MARLALSGDSGAGEKWTHSNEIQEVKMTGLAEELEVRALTENNSKGLVVAPIAKSGTVGEDQMSSDLACGVWGHPSSLPHMHRWCTPPIPPEHLPRAEPSSEHLQPRTPL